MKKLSLIVKYVFITPWCPVNRLVWYRVMILSMHVSGTTRTAVFFSGLTLNNKESNRIYFSSSVYTLLIAILEKGSLFCDKYQYRSLKYEICKYPACISLISSENEYLSVPFFGLSLIFCLYLSVLVNIYELNFLYL